MGEEKEKDYSDLPPYEPTLDLRDYKYPKTDLLETHGSEKIVQDPAELAAAYRDLQNRLPRLTVLGGCCGTDRRHIDAICAAVTG